MTPFEERLNKLTINIANWMHESTLNSTEYQKKADNEFNNQTIFGHVKNIEQLRNYDYERGFYTGLSDALLYLDREIGELVADYDKQRCGRS